MQPRLGLVTGVALVAALAGCDWPGGSDADGNSSSAAPEITITVPPERLTPFCQSIAELDAALAESSGGADDRTTIIAAYTEIVDAAEVPELIAADFTHVIEELKAPPPPTSTPPATTSALVATTTTSTSTTSTTSPSTSSADGDSTSSAPGTGPTSTEYWDEGYGPEDTPAARVAAYIDFACEDAANNPGPPDTEPNTPVDSTLP